jgi:hypothetical protein
VRTLTLLLFVTVSTSCSLCRSYCEEHPSVKYEYLPANTSCLAEPPPVEQDVKASVDSACPAQFALCLGVDAGLALEHNIKAHRRWEKEAWIRCSAVDGGVRIDGGM